MLRRERGGIPARAFILAQKAATVQPAYHVARHGAAHAIAARQLRLLDPPACERDTADDLLLDLGVNVLPARTRHEADILIRRGRSRPRRGARPSGKRANGIAAPGRLDEKAIPLKLR